MIYLCGIPFEFRRDTTYNIKDHKYIMSDTTTPVPAQNLTDGMHVVVDTLKRNGVKVVYGVVGIPVTDLARHLQECGIRYVGFRHEQSAGNAAAITGYLTQKPGILLTVSAPGFLNGLTALANATINGYPMIQISGSSNRAIIDLQQGDYEGLDQMNVAKPFCKASYRINRPEDIPVGIARAIRAAVSGRPGGVYLDLTTALLESVIDQDVIDKCMFVTEDPAPAYMPSAQSVEKAMGLLAQAKHPLIILGKGASYSQTETDIRAFIEKTGIPYFPMSMAKGLLPDDHPQCAIAARSFALENSDVVMLIGARLNWLLSHGKGKHWNPNVKFVQIDIDPEEIDSNQHIQAPIVGDIASSMKCLLSALEKQPFHADTDWMDQIKKAEAPNVAKMAAKLSLNPTPMNFYSALNAVKKVMDKNQDVILVNEGANTLDDTRDVISMQNPRHRLDCGTWGVMGIGMGFAIGAAITTGKRVVCIEGDSAFGFSGMEIETICRFKLPVTIVIFNNGGIYKGDCKNLGGGSDPSPTTLMANAQYDKMIEAFGGIPYNATTPDELQSALEAGLTADRPTLINCVIDPSVGTESGHIGNLNPKVILQK